MSLRARLALFRRARFKFTVYYTGIQLVFLVILCAFLYHRASRSLLSELDRFIRDQADDLIAFVENHPGDWAAIASQMNLESAGERVYETSFRIVDPQGNTLASSRLFRDGLVPPIRPEVRRTALRRRTHTETIWLPDRPSGHYLLTRPFLDEATGEIPYIVQGLAYLEPIDTMTRRFRLSIYSAFPAFLVVSFVGGYILARKVLKPVRLIARTARDITWAKLDRRLTPSGSGDEFDLLAHTLNDMIQRLQESFAMLRQFAADAAHELRTPLTIMKGEAEIALRSKEPDPEVYRETLISNIRECDHMIGIITNLLFLAQADTGDVPLHLETFRLDELLSELAETFQVLAEEAQLAVEASAFPEIRITGDRSRLHELFANLLDNAVKYTPAGGRISMSCDLGSGFARVAVSDTGIGIPEADHEKIFERFYRTDPSRNRATGGCGIGLSIARWIVKAHSGTIEVHSALGAGSTFVVTLPLTPPPPLTAAEAEGAARAAPEGTA